MYATRAAIAVVVKRLDRSERVAVADASIIHEHAAVLIGDDVGHTRRDIEHHKIVAAVRIAGVGHGADVGGKHANDGAGDRTGAERHGNVARAYRGGNKRETHRQRVGNDHVANGAFGQRNLNPITDRFTHGVARFGRVREEGFLNRNGVAHGDYRGEATCGVVVQRATRAISAGALIGIGARATAVGHARFVLNRLPRLHAGLQHGGEGDFKLIAHHQCEAGASETGGGA